MKSSTLKVPDVGDRVRQAAETVYRALIEAELTDVIGAAPHRRTDERTNQRNGHRTRILSTNRCRHPPHGGAAAGAALLRWATAAGFIVAGVVAGVVTLVGARSTGAS